MKRELEKRNRSWFTPELLEELRLRELMLLKRDLSERQEEINFLKAVDAELSRRVKALHHQGQATGENRMIGGRGMKTFKFTFYDGTVLIGSGEDAVKAMMDAMANAPATHDRRLDNFVNFVVEESVEEKIND